MSHASGSSFPFPAIGVIARFLHRVLEPRVLGPIIGALAMVLGLFAIHALHGRIHLHEVRAAVAATPLPALALALAFTALSFLALAGYDVVAARRVAPEKISTRLAALAGFIAYGFSNALGFHVFIGGPLRYRIYQSAGVDAADVGRITGISVLTAWGGIVVTLALVLLFDPAGLPLLQHVTPAADRALGGLLLAGMALAFFWLARHARQLTLLGWRFPLPGGRQALLQVAVGAVDYGATAAALYVLLPADVLPGYAAFLLLFIGAMLLGVLSHAPGGLGVFEATLLLGLGAGARADVLAALIVFRVIYYLIPLLAAALALLAFEAHRVRLRVPAAAGRALALTRHLVPPIAATLSFVGGLVLLLSGSTPAITQRLDWLRQTLPLPFAEASHLLASLIGLLLVVLARGLYRRARLARQLALALLVAGALFALAKGLDWDEALLLVAGAAVLAAYGEAFYRGGGWRALRLDWRWIGLLLVLLAATLALGLAANRHVAYRNDLWWHFAWRGDASRFLRASLLVGVSVAALVLDAVINRPGRAPAAPGMSAIPDAVRDILSRASGTEACVALLGDKRFMIAPGGDAFLMYAVSGHSWISMGDPVGERAAARALIWRFAGEVDRAGADAVFYQVQPEFLPGYLDMNLALLKIGEVARVDLAGYSLAGPARAGLRQAYHRAGREGLAFSVVPRSEVAAVLPQLRAVSDAWLASKHGREKGFSIGRFEDAYISEFDCAVLRRDGTIVAFANLWRSGDGQELSIDLMRYQPGVSRVLMEALFVHLFLYGSAQGYRWFNLGAAPLSGLSDHPMATTWDRIGTFIYRRGDEFYNFSGLRAFKEKFAPVWTPQYMACRGGLSLTRALTDVTLLIAGGAMGVFRK